MLSAIINIFLPGVGQMIQGRVGQGILWFIGSIFGYMLFVVPGVIVHIMCILNASNYEKLQQERLRQQERDEANRKHQEQMQQLQMLQMQQMSNQKNND